MARAEKLVRYVSPFGSPAWMPREVAERHMEEDDRLYVTWQKLGMLSDRHREIGPPYIQSTEQRRRELDARTTR